jgi:uncharacterized protein YgbK (DUF1537 family)
MLIGAIADDLTGATDLGLMFARAGLRVLQCAGHPGDSAELAGYQAVIVALKTRTIEPSAAVEQSLAALAALQSAGARQILFKYCSTFDSTDGGNIGPVTDALMHALGVGKTISCPAMPENGRTVYQGHLFVGSQLLSDSPMKDHPLTPMRDANLVRVLQRQSRHPVSLVTHPVVAEGGYALTRARGEGHGIAIVDAVDQDDLLRIGAACAGLALVTGGSGIGLGIAANLVKGEPSPPYKVEPTAGEAVILAGSCSQATLRQLARAIQAGFPSLRISPADIADGSITLTDAIAFATAGHERPPVIFSSASIEEIALAQDRLGTQAAGALVEDFLAEVARGLLEQGFTRFIVAGGETSGAVTQALGVKTLAIGPEIDPGVPWTAFMHDTRTIALALKSGNFGADDFLIKAWDLLR